MARPVKVGAAYDEQSVRELIVMYRRNMAPHGHYPIAHRSPRSEVERQRMAEAYAVLIRLHGCTDRIPPVAPSGRHPGQGASYEAKDRVALGKIIKRAEKDTTRSSAINRKIIDKASWLISVIERESYAADGAISSPAPAASSPSATSSSSAA